jgi:hypothetical protein
MQSFRKVGFASGMNSSVSTTLRRKNTKSSVLLVVSGNFKILTEIYQGFFLAVLCIPVLSFAWFFMTKFIFKYIINSMKFYLYISWICTNMFL